MNPDMIRIYADYYGTRDIWAQRALSGAAEGWKGTSESVCNLNELSRTEFYNDFLLPFEIPHAIWGVVQRTPRRIVNIGIYRNGRKGPFNERNLELIEFLGPHLKRAFHLHLQISELKSRSEDMAASLNMLAFGVVLLGPAGRIVAMNQSASRTVAKNDGLLAMPLGLRAWLPEESGELESLIRRAELTSIGEGLGAGGAIRISRRQGPPLQLLVTPSRRFPLEANRDVRTLVFINDPAHKVRTPVKVLESLFGLTPAECRLALLLADGNAPPQIADMLGLSANTIKSQLASIYQKTGTSRQAQLVRLLSQLGAVEEP
jgi:DNA-binding CsgD family transcriptional regulator